MSNVTFLIHGPLLNPRFYFHFKHLTKSYPLEKGCDGEWYLVGEDERDVNSLTFEVPEIWNCTPHDFGEYLNALSLKDIVTTGIKISGYSEWLEEQEQYRKELYNGA